jgi:hypothetical protein
MSDDVFAVRTGFNDVAELGQGYLERADGERMLLPLPVEVTQGEGVRFIVYLVDGTPAFAGAGRAVQVSDQGGEVAAEDRYETLIDGLVFDERSRPVYDYIVAVRQMAYADLGAAAEAEAAVGEEAVLESEEPTTHNEPISPALLESMRAEPMPIPSEHPADTISIMPAEPLAALVREAEMDPSEDEPLPAALATPTEIESEQFGDLTPQDANAGLAFVGEQTTVAESDEIAQALAAAHEEPAEAPRSMMPLPTGILRRPAIAAGWQPVAAKRPQPSAGSGLFRYAPGKLPVPAKPPRPDLRPDQRLQPAAAPARS